jgi:hypothetical protein
VGAPFVGYRIPHKHSRRPPLGEFAWAAWTRGRLVALEAPERGEFRTWNLVFQGNQLRLNCRTRHAGWVRVEAVGADGPIPGRTFDDCDPVTGDHLDRLVTWKGESAIPRQPDQPVAFRVRLAAAELYAMGFE